jgi:hypothetical protein
MLDSALAHLHIADSRMNYDLRRSSDTSRSSPHLLFLDTLSLAIHLPLRSLIEFGLLIFVIFGAIDPRFMRSWSSLTTGKWQ